MFREFFYLHKSDRRILLSALVVLAVAVMVIVLGGRKGEPAPAVGAPPPVDQPETPFQAPPADGQAPFAAEQPRAERFAFDPNTADSTQLLRLGLAPWQVRNIYKYRAKGGVYRSKQDFAQLYGLTVKQYRELEPYIRISPDYQPASTLFGGQRQPAPNDTAHERQPLLRYPVKLAEGETIDLASADTAALQRVPGIGPYYARRIEQYGRQLGGYVSLDQLMEIEDFPSEALPFFTLTAPAPRRLNVNTLSLNELKRHPYINFYMARAIVDYRRQHGTISDLNDLRLLPDFPADVIERLRPYVEY
ncbi:MAG: helix-hairpin-helix domain-containing protein [Prevotella sp.]|nr:helix-hairpin-helix domain-containing protein [Prevotella sp.]